MSDLNKAQIESFDVFAAAIKDYLDGISEEDRKGFRKVTKIGFGDLLVAATRPSFLKPVMNNTTKLKDEGVTKERYQLRFPETKPDGTPHPQANELRFTVAGDRMLSDAHCRMYTLEAYRAMRTEATGLSTPETIYWVASGNIPANVRDAFRGKFPNNSQDAEGDWKYPLFKANGIGLVLKKGNKVPKGQKRHSWARFDVVILGTYGDQEVVIDKAGVMLRGSTADIAKVVGCPCPDWGQTEQPTQVQEETQETATEAASSLVSRGVAMLDGFFSKS